MMDPLGWLLAGWLRAVGCSDAPPEPPVPPLPPARRDIPRSSLNRARALAPSKPVPLERRSRR